MTVFTKCIAALLALTATGACYGAGYAEMVTDLSPISYWRLGETLGLTVSDEMEVSDGLYISGLTLGVVGPIDGNTAAEFDGFLSHASIPHDDAYLLDEGAVSMWFKADGPRTRQELFSKDSTNFDTGGHLTIMLKNTHAEVRIQSTTSSYWLDSDNFDIEQWNHILVTFGPAGVQLYINGELEDSDPYTGGLGASSGGIGNHEPIVLGANAWQSNDLLAIPLQDYFNGRLDEVFILDYQPSESQIANMASPTGNAGGNSIRVVQWQTLPPVENN